MKLIIPDIWKSSHGEEHKENEKIKDKDVENLASCVLSVMITLMKKLISVGSEFHCRRSPLLMVQAYGAN